AKANTDASTKPSPPESPIVCVFTTNHMFYGLNNIGAAVFIFLCLGAKCAEICFCYVCQSGQHFMAGVSYGTFTTD
ncbi:hypothetical protein, partial [Fulvivirga kasyanovii]|uniref:hypothetical protein n=1 Tax=Fulvivirga kasyanovii TaxID=396812 RepID=UPI001C8849FC